MIRAFVNNHGATFFKYAMVGATGTVIDVGVFALLLHFTSLGDAISGHIVAATISFILATVNNYQWNRVWTFKHHHATHRQFTKFLVVSVGGWLLNAGLLALFSAIILQIAGDLPTWASVLIKMSVSSFVLMYNFLANRFWTFRHHQPF